MSVPSLLMPAASYGDLVCGLANIWPPMSYVGKIGNPSQSAAQGLTSGTLRAGGLPPPGGPIVRINGNRLGTLTEMAMALPASQCPGMAFIRMGSGIARVLGQAVTLKLGFAQVTPTSVMFNLGGAQSFVKLEGLPLTIPPLPPPPGAPPPPPGSPDSMPGSMPDSELDQARHSVPPRESFDDPTMFSQMLSDTTMARQTDLAPAEHEVLVGDPVNVVTGAVISERTDFEQPSPSLRFHRRYDSRRSDRCSSLGHGWSHELDQQIYLEVGRVVFRDGDGREKEFSTVGLAGQVSRPGDTLEDATGRYRLRCVAPMQWELSDGQTVRHFAPVTGASADDKERGVARLVRLARPGQGTVTECVYESESESESGRLTEIRVDDQCVLRFEYSERNLIRRVFSVSSAGELMQATMEYSAAADLVKVSDARGRTREYEYVDHLMVRQTNRNGGSVYYAYDGVGCRARCTRTWGDGGYMARTLDYDPAAGITTVHDSLEQQTIYHHNGAGLVTRIDGSHGDRRTLRYDARLRLIAIEWPDGSSETATYDKRGNLARRTFRDGSAHTLEYGPDGRLTEATDALGGRWGYQYDERGRLRRVEDPQGHSTRIDFDERGGMCRITEATGNQTFIRLNAQGQILEMPRPGRGRVGFSYDERGRLSAARDSDDRRTRWHHDERGHLIHRDGFTTRTSWEYSAEGRLIEVKHGRQASRITRDAFGLVRAIEVEGRHTRYIMDTEGRLLRVREGDGEDDLLTLERTESGHVEAWEAADVGRCEVQRQPLSSRITGLQMPDRTVTIEWNEQGRIGALQVPEGSRCTYAYRPDGMLVHADNEHVTCEWERGPRGAIISQRWGETAIEQLHPDHRGRRCGLRMVRDDAELKVSYLRTRQGAIEDVAVTTGAEIEAATELRGRDQADPTPHHRLGVAAFDPLWRPISARGTAHQVWDEDHCLVLDGQPRVHHPDDGHLMFVVGANGTVQPVADDTAAKDLPKQPMVDRVHQAAFPAISDAEAAEDALPTPTMLLREVLGYRAWNPDVRPIPGRAPWNPDEWQAQVESPRPDDGRLDSDALLRALGSPHVRTELAI
ncbi:MAG: DUF6531 domain-containing protein [Myxococcota bacterium]